jgi:uncharacterized damage-inducible protein DinB
MAAKIRKPIALGEALVESLAVNERINQCLLENLDDEAWRADPPGGKGRTVAAIVAHIHNVRHMWLAVSAKGSGIELPDKVDRNTLTKAQAVKALAKSHAALSALVRQSVEGDGRIRDFKPDVVNFVGYVIAHEAHHRGQVAMLARQLGHPLPQKAGFGMWEWGSRWKECGFEE